MTSSPIALEEQTCALAWPEQSEDPQSYAALLAAINLVIEGLRRLILAGSIGTNEADLVWGMLGGVLRRGARPRGERM